MVRVKLSNKLFYVLIAIIVVILIALGVYAYGTSNPSVMGHTWGEMSTPYACSSGQFLKYAPGDTYGPWICSVVNQLSNPPTCYGTNKGLQWTGSAWSCVTFISSVCAYACAGTGWYPACTCEYTDPNMMCGTGKAVKVTQRYCANGVDTNIKDVYCCPSINGQCPYQQ